MSYRGLWKLHILSVVTAALLIFIGCSDKGVASSYCKADDSSPTADIGRTLSSPSADAGDDPDGGTAASADFSGLYCFAYHVEGGTSLQVNIINFWASCRGPFEARVTGTGATSADIEIMPVDCAGAGCFCPYDFTSVPDGVNLKSDLLLTVGRVSCITGTAESWEKATLPLSESDSGLVCQYMGMGIGGLHAPCRTNDTCDEGLLCTETETLSGMKPVCLLPCETESDCPIPSVFTCDDGACHVKPGMTQTT